MRTLSGQIVEIVGTEMQLIAEINDDRIISDPEAREIIGDCNDLDVLRAALLEVRSKALAYLDSLSDAELAEEVPSRGGWLGALRLGAIPRAEVFITIAQHEWYHVGQLTSYLWARGDHPYNW